MVECTGEILNEVKRYYEYLMKTNDDEVFEVVASYTESSRWPDENGRLTYKRKDKFIVSNLNGKDVLLIYKHNAGMSIEVAQALFYYNDVLIFKDENRGYDSSTGGNYYYDAFYYFPECEEQGLSFIRNQFTYYVYSGQFRNANKKALKHICNFLHLNEQALSPYFKKERPSKF